MVRTARFYESADGEICAIVYHNGKPYNIVSDLQDCLMRGNDLIKAAQTGFEYADMYDSAEYHDKSLDELVDEIDYSYEEIAQISPNNVILYEDYMSDGAIALFCVR